MHMLLNYHAICSLPHLQRAEHISNKAMCFTILQHSAIDTLFLYAAEIVQKEGTKLASRQDFAKRVALDLFRSQACNTTVCTQ